MPSARSPDCPDHSRPVGHRAPTRTEACQSFFDHEREIDSPYDEGSGGPGGWWILFEPELHLGRDILVPDLAGWRRARMPTLPETAYFELAPDWVCEVLSPSTAQVDRVDKPPIYASHGVGHVWLVDPDVRTLEVFALHEGHWRPECAFKAADEVCAPPFEALSFGLASLWP